MSFSSDQPQVTNQLPITVTLPNIDEKYLFAEKVEDYLKDITSAVNSKEEGQYLLQEKGPSSLYYSKDIEGPLRDVYRKTFDFVKLNGGSIAGGETVQQAHEITGLFESAGIYAHCTSVDGLYFTVVFPDIRLDRTSVIFTNPHTEALVQCDVVSNFLKN